MKTSLPTNPRYKYRLHVLLQRLSEDKREQAMKDLPLQLQVTPRTFKGWIYIYADAKWEIPGRALLQLANHFDLHPRDMFTDPPGTRPSAPAIRRMEMKSVVQWFQENGVDIGTVAFTDNYEIKTLCPASAAGFKKVIESAPYSILTLLGFVLWDESPALFMYPPEWYDCVPEGTFVVDAGGEVWRFNPDAFKKSITKHDCLDFGFVRNPHALFRE